VVSPLAEPEGAWETKGSGFRELDLRPSQPHPRSHGSTDMDPAGRKQEEMAHRYYKDMGELTRDTAFREGVRRVILAGPSEITAAFRTALTNDLKDRVVAEDHVDLSASEGARYSTVWRRSGSGPSTSARPACRRRRSGRPASAGPRRL